MNWMLFIGLGIVAAIAFMGWGFVRITRRTADAAALAASVKESEIPSLTAECIRICHDKLGVTLSLSDFENSSQSLDYVLEPSQRMRMKMAFEVQEHSGYFVLPLGAFLGEFVRTHNPGARWIAGEKGGLAMEFPQNDTVLTMYPFDKVLKHAATGKAGDILAYLHVAAGKH